MKVLIMLYLNKDYFHRGGKRELFLAEVTRKNKKLSQKSLKVRIKYPIYDHDLDLTWIVRKL